LYNIIKTILDGKEKIMKLSNQAIGAVMMVLQKGIMEQIDITTLLQEFEMIDSTDGLIVENPPIIEPEKLEQETEEAQTET
tara:strand:- start:810 stop:1052 length:243 start_codon:yes stop_codon:yes gene_type:complete